MRVALCGVASSAPLACLGVEWWTLRRVEGSGAEAVSGVEECGSHAPNEAGEAGAGAWASLPLCGS